MPDSRVLRIRRKRRSRERQAADRAQALAIPVPAGSMGLTRLPAMVLLGACVWLLVTLLVDARFRVQELTVSGAEHLSVEEIERVVDAQGVGVVMDCRHLCMMMRGVEKQNSIMTTSTVLGQFRRSEATRLEFLNLIDRPEV